jgi:hypothetical protein
MSILEDVNKLSFKPAPPNLNPPIGRLLSGFGYTEH